MIFLLDLNDNDDDEEEKSDEMHKTEITEAKEEVAEHDDEEEELDVEEDNRDEEVEVDDLDCDYSQIDEKFKISNVNTEENGGVRDGQEDEEMHVDQDEEKSGDEK